MKTKLQYSMQQMSLVDDFSTFICYDICLSHLKIIARITDWRHLTEFSIKIKGIPNEFLPEMSLTFNFPDKNFDKIRH
jgi:hypothetical protein